MRKKTPLISYLGATAAFGIVLMQAGKMTKKYGQPMFPKKKSGGFSLGKLNGLIDKALPLFEKFRKKPETTPNLQ